MAAARRTSGIARNAIANWTLFAITALVSFFLAPFLVNNLGATRYGLWSFLAVLTTYLGLLDVGIRQAVSRYVAHHHAVGEAAESSIIVSTAVKLLVLLGFVAVVLSCVVAFVAPLLFNIPDDLVIDARIVIVLSGLTVAASLISGAFGGILTGLERFDIDALLEIFVLACRTIAIVVAVKYGYDLVMLASIHLVAAVLGCIGFFVAIRRLFQDLKLRLNGLQFPQARIVLSFGASMGVIFLLGRIVSNSDAIIIASILPIDSVTFFAIAGSLCLYAKDVVWALSNVMAPRVSAMTSRGSNRVKDEVLVVAMIGTLIATPIAVTFFVRGESFIALWMGAIYGPVSGEVLKVLAAVVWLEAGRSLVVNTLVGLGKQRNLIPGFTFEAVSKLALSYVLAFPLGLPGVALGTLIPSVLINFGYIPRCLSVATGVPVRLYFERALLLPTVACVPFAVATVLIERYAPAANMLLFFIEVTLILPLVPATAWFLCLTNAERLSLRDRITRLNRN